MAYVSRSHYNENVFHHKAMESTAFSFDYEPCADYYRVTLKRDGYSASTIVSSAHLVDDKRPHLEAAIDRMIADQERANASSAS